MLMYENILVCCEKVSVAIDRRQRPRYHRLLLLATRVGILLPLLNRRSRAPAPPQKKWVVLWLSQTMTVGIRPGARCWTASRKSWRAMVLKALLQSNFSITS